jgi:RNA polymerase nonessential primary-like sigma factor
MKMKQMDYAYKESYEDNDVDSPGFDDSQEDEEGFDASFDEDEEREESHSVTEKRKKSSREPYDKHYRLLFDYFKDLNDEKLLTKRDEIVLAAKIKICEEWSEKLSKLTKSKSGAGKSGAFRSKEVLDALRRSYTVESKRLQDRFIKSNLRLVIELANRYTGKGLPLTDLIQEGNIGLMKAVTKFDHTKGFKFSTYASWWIHQSLSRAIMEQTHVIHIPVYVQELASKVFRAKAKLERSTEKRIYPEDISEEANIPIDAVNAILKGGDIVVPLDLPSANEDTKTYLDIMPDPEAKRAEHYLDSRSITEGIRDSLELLSDRERDILMMRFGIDYDDDHKLEQIANKYSLSRERIRQIEKEALGKLADSEHGQVLREFLN